MMSKCLPNVDLSLNPNDVDIRGYSLVFSQSVMCQIRCFASRAKQNVSFGRFVVLFSLLGSSI